MFNKRERESQKWEGRGDKKSKVGRSQKQGVDKRVKNESGIKRGKSGERVRKLAWEQNQKWEGRGHSM